MANNLYRIEVIARVESPKLEGEATVYADGGIAFAKIHPVRIKATPRAVLEHCDWCKPGEELCGTCRKFFDYYGDGGSDKCSAECKLEKCANFEPLGFCPRCGAKGDGARDENL